MNTPGVNGSDPSALIYDWNREPEVDSTPPRRFELVDETLRDGCQSPSVLTPTLEEKIQLLHLMDSLGIAWCNLGLPGAGRRSEEDIAALQLEIARSRLRIRGQMACRTLVEPDVRKAVELVQRTGVPVNVYTFIGSSPIRQWAEDWSLDFIVRQTRDAISFAVKEGLDVVYVTEDTTRSHPDTLRMLFDAAIGAGARGLCICDTVGHLTSAGLTRLTGFIRETVQSIGAEGITLDLHGHNDRGLSLALGLQAIELGFDRVHGCALGIGERVGNTAMDQLILNLKLLGWWEHDTTRLVEYVRVAAQATGVPIPVNYPLAGRDAFRTSTGVHAGAIIKALQKGEVGLADRVYSAVPAHEFGRDQEIEVGPMSGVWGATYWLQQHAISTDSQLIETILARAKSSNHVLSDQEILGIVDAWRVVRACQEAQGDPIELGVV
jgi:2-isopropylmalate synthase